MNIYNILRVSKRLPPESLRNVLISRKTGIKTNIVSSYPCILNNSYAGTVKRYSIEGNSGGVGKAEDDKYVIPIISNGKNWFDISKLISGYRIKWSTGDLYKDSTAEISDYIPAIQFEYCTNYRVCVAAYDAEYGYIGSLNSNGWGLTTGDFTSHFILPANAKFFRIFVYGGTKKFPETTQLKFGSESTDYEPYHNPIKTSIYLDTPLTAGEILKYPENIIKYSDGSMQRVVLPKIPIFFGTTIITTDTEIKPNFKITYKVRK